MRIWIETNVVMGNDAVEIDCVNNFVAVHNGNQRIVNAVVFDLCSIGRGRKLWLNAEYTVSKDTEGLKAWAKHIEDRFEDFKLGFMAAHATKEVEDKS